MASQQEIKLIISALNKTEGAFADLKKGLADIREHSQKTAQAFGLFGNGLTQAAGAFMLLKGALDMIAAPLKSAFEAARAAVDDYNISIVKTAALVTGMMTKDDRSLGERYAEAKSYAEGLAVALEDIDKRTLLSAKDLQGITEEMAKQGILLDYNNKKQVASFEALANALAVISAGAPNREIQLRQEARALLQGEVNVHSQLAQILQAQTGNLQEQIDLHRRQGDVLEWLGEQLQGFTAASGDIQSTWEAIRTSLETLWTQVIRGGLGPAFQTVVQKAQRLSEWATAHREQIQAGILCVWQSIVGLFETASNLFRGFSPVLSPVKDLVVTIAEGWRAIATVYLPPLAGLIGDIVRPLGDMLRTLGNIGRVAALIIAEDFAAADKAFQDMKASWLDWQQSSGNVVSGKFLDTYTADFSRRLAEYEKAWEARGTKAGGAVPKITAARTDREKSEAQAAAEAWLKQEVAAIKKRESEAIAALKIEALEKEKAHKAGLISQQELMEERRRLSAEVMQAEIMAIDLQIAAQRKLLGMKSGAYKDAKERIKEEGDIHAEITKLEGERAKKVAEGKEKGLRFDIEGIEYQNKLAKAQRDGELKNLETAFKLEQELLKLRVEKGEATVGEATEKELANERALLRLKMENLRADLAAEGDDAKRRSIEVEMSAIQKRLEAEDLLRAKIAEGWRQTRETAVERQISARQTSLALAEMTGDYEEQYRLAAEIVTLEKEKLLLQKDLSQAQREAIERLYAEKERRAELMQSPLGAVSLGFEDMISKWKDTTKQLYDIAQTTATAMRDAFSDIFFDAFQGKLKSVGDYITSFVNTVNRAIANYLADMAAAGLIKSIGGTVGNLLGIGVSSGSTTPVTGATGQYFKVNESLRPTWHGGGIVGSDVPAKYRLVPNFVFASAPRFHGGFAPDEYPAILQRGEAVFTPAQMRALGGVVGKGVVPRVTVNIRNESGTEMTAGQQDIRFDHEQLIINVVAKKAKSSPEFRNLLATGGRV